MALVRKTITLTDTLVDKIRQEAIAAGIPDWAYVAALRVEALKSSGLEAKLADLRSKVSRKPKGRPKKVI